MPGNPVHGSSMAWEACLPAVSLEGTSQLARSSKGQGSAEKVEDTDILPANATGAVNTELRL